MEATLEPHAAERTRRFTPIVPLLIAAALFLVPWAVWLGRTLPATHTARHWALAWAGFDVGLALALASTAISAVRHSPWLVAAASATGTLLVIDSWFDVLTAHSGSELAIAAAEAALVELPLAALSFWIVRDAERAIETLCDCLHLPHPAANRAIARAHLSEHGC